MKRYHVFRATIRLDELSALPYVNGVLFAKLKLHDGHFEALSSRSVIKRHSVTWGESFDFTCSIADTYDGVLQASMLRVSVRKETHGGKSFDRMGFVNINLAECAGLRAQERFFILEGKESGKRRHDNSILKVTITLALKSSDPCFKLPLVKNIIATEEDPTNPIVQLVSNAGSVPLSNGNVIDGAPNVAENYFIAPSTDDLSEEVENDACIQVMLAHPSDTRTKIARSHVSAAQVVADILAECNLVAGSTEDTGVVLNPQCNLESYLTKDGVLSFNDRKSLEKWSGAAV